MQALATPHIAGYSLEGKLRGTFMLYQRFTEYLGAMAGKQFSSILPLPEKPIMVLDDATTALDVINFLYNYDDDDTRFRDSLPLTHRCSVSSSIYCVKPILLDANSHH